MKKYFHISPNNFNRFTPHYNKTLKAKGVFVTDYHSALHDWMFWVFNKRNKDDYEDHYSHVILYTLEIPKFAVSNSLEYMNYIYDNQDWNESKIFSFWCWGYQVFILEEYCRFIKIIGKEKISYTQAINRLNSHLNNRWVWFMNQRRKEKEKENK